MKRRVGGSLAAILDNPIAVREWRRLRRRAGNWRIWLGVNWPLDPIVWGAPVILTYAVAPYALWAVLAGLRGFHLTGPEKVPFDAMAMLALVFCFYVVAISLVLGATAITHEREQQTWDPLRVTALSRRERAAGFLWGRLGPVWASVLATAGLWWLLQPNYSSLLSTFMETRTSRSVLADGTLVTLGLSLLVGEIGLLTSARCKSTAAAVVMAVLIAVPVAIVGAACLGGALLIGVALLTREAPPLNFPAAGSPWQAIYLLFYLWAFVSLCASIWDMLERRLET